MRTGTTPAYSLGPLQERGRLFAAEGDEVYEGQLVGIHSKDNDLTVNAIKPKQLTNLRASGKDDAIKLTPAIKYSLEQALDFIEDDELVEVTPKEIRLRKKFLHRERPQARLARGLIQTARTHRASTRHDRRPALQPGSARASGPACHRDLRGRQGPAGAAGGQRPRTARARATAALAA